jgi:type IV pilus assembly protein PilO
MNDLVDRLMDMPVRQRVLMLVGLVFMTFFAYAYFVYWPRVDLIAAMRTDLEMKVDDLNKKKALAANLPQAKLELEDLRAALRLAVAQLPDTKEIPDLLSGISAVARESGLEIAQFRQRPEIYRDFYAEVPVEILVRGTYFQVEEFFNQVGQLTRIVNVKDIGMKGPNVVEEDPVKLQTSCSATTFRFLDEEEREQLRLEREAKAKGKKR